MQDLLLEPLNRNIGQGTGARRHIFTQPVLCKGMQRGNGTCSFDLKNDCYYKSSMRVPVSLFSPAAGSKGHLIPCRLRAGMPF